MRRFSLRTAFITTSLLIFILSSGCQGSTLPPTVVASATPITVIPTETSLPAPDVMKISVPQGNPPVIDGTLSPGEWEQALIDTFTDGSEILLMHADGYMYLGLRANTPEMIVGNILINIDGKIEILHASAALGKGIYLKEGDQWQLDQGFEWCCRETSDSEMAQARRENLLQEDGWTATNSRIGAPNELEYQIEVTDETLRMAVNYIKASETDVKIPWPNDLDDDTVKPTPGGLPEQLHFSPNEWATIDFQ